MCGDEIKTHGHEMCDYKIVNVWPQDNNLFPQDNNMWP